MKPPRHFIFIFFFASFLLVNAGHLLTSQIGLAHTSSTGDSETKSSLADWFLACKAFYQDIGSDNTCTLGIAEEEKYGLVHPKDVVLHGWGLENDFCIVGWHQDTNIIYAMNAEGMLLEMGVLPVVGELSQGKPQKVWIFEEFPPSKMAFLIFGGSLFASALLLMPFYQTERKPGVMTILIVTVGIFTASTGIYYFQHSSYQEQYLKDSRNYSRTLEEFIQSDHAQPQVFCQAFPNRI